MAAGSAGKSDWIVFYIKEGDNPSYLKLQAGQVV